MVTFRANRNNIEAMSLGVSFVMVVLFSLTSTIVTFKRRCRKHFLSMNRISYGGMRKPFVFIASSVSNSFVMLVYLVLRCLGILSACLFVCFGLSMSFSSCPAFFGLTVSFLRVFRFLTTAISGTACFAFWREAVFTYASFVKFSEWFDFLANRASFGYDYISHIRNSIRLWLKPLASNELATGLFYYTGKGVIVK
jgi:hypothetical protein